MNVLTIRFEIYFLQRLLSFTSFACGNTYFKTCASPSTLDSVTLY